MDDIKAKQQIVEKITASTNILVTVSNDPSVDALSAALGLTLLLDKLDKHVTAVFSGAVPPAISFLEPEKTFDSTTDSLRDFIIALDKEKADHLRYKVEGDSVRIFITPYKTTITKDDLQFSQGDFNVDLVIALGVDNQDHLDKALETHGQILHDATIITVTAGDHTSTLGGIDWHDAQSSSISEMVTGLAEALKTDKTKSLLDIQVSTALLTGIVAETDRFSNTRTTTRVMTTAAQLMAGGADQQLIASRLAPSDEIGDVAVTAASQDTAYQKDESQTSKDSLDISHTPTETLEQLDQRVKASEQAETPPVISSAYAPEPDDTAVEPTLGGRLNATTEQAAEDARAEQAGDQNTTLLAHSYLDSSPTLEQAPINGSAVPADLGLPMPPAVPDFSQMATPAPISAYALDLNAAPPERLGDILAPEPTIQPLPPAPIISAPIPVPTPDPTDPGQFKIPGQQ